MTTSPPPRPGRNHGFHGPPNLEGAIPKSRPRPGGVLQRPGKVLRRPGGERPMSRYQSLEQRNRFQKLAADLGIDLTTLERRIPNPAAFERDVLRGNLKPLVQLLPTPTRPPTPRRRHRRKAGNPART